MRDEEIVAGISLADAVDAIEVARSKLFAYVYRDRDDILAISRWSEIDYDLLRAQRLLLAHANPELFNLPLKLRRS